MGLPQQREKAGSDKRNKKRADERNESPPPRRPIFKYQNQERHVPSIGNKKDTLEHGWGNPPFRRKT